MPHSVILNGFDRSGSSAISQSLARLAKVELFMQPFNSGPVRQKMYEIWDGKVADDADVNFFKGLEKGVLHKEYIKSHWFHKHSSVQEFHPNKLHLIKTTINHFLIDWAQSEFPLIDQWAIWRNPMDILTSLIRNDFIGQWYTDGVSSITPAVEGHALLREHYYRFIGQLNHLHLQAAFLIAVRSHYLFSYVQKDKVIVYEKFKKDNAQGLRHFVDYYGLEPNLSHDTTDKNIIGKSYNAEIEYDELFDAGHNELIRAIFAPLIDLFESNFIQD